MELTIPTSGPPASARVTHLRSQLPEGVLAMGPDPVRLTWRIEPASAALHQLAYECQAVASDDVGEVLPSTGTVASAEQVAVLAPGEPLQSREVRHYRVRIQTEAGWTELSPALRVEAGLLEASDWSAKAVTLPDDPGRERPSPCPMLRRQFDVGGEVVSARLYVTSLGLHRLTLNGKLVSEDLLAPGWTAYRHRLLAETYDVTPLLAAWRQRPRGPTRRWLVPRAPGLGAGWAPMSLRLGRRPHRAAGGSAQRREVTTVSSPTRTG